MWKRFAPYAPGRKTRVGAINAIRQTFPDASHFFQNLANKSVRWCVAVFAFLAKFMYRSSLSYGDVASYLHINTSIIWIIQSRGGGADKSLPQEMARVSRLEFRPTCAVRRWNWITEHIATDKFLRLFIWGVAIKNNNKISFYVLYSGQNIR